METACRAKPKTRTEVALAKLKNTLRRRGVGRWFYQNFHARLHRFRDYRQFGVIRGCRLRFGQQAMRRAARSLKPIPLDPQGFPIVFFTGERYWFQTLFCAHSLARHLNRSIDCTIIDDGSLHPDLVSTL